MIDRIVTLAGTALMLAATVGPAFAQAQPGALPEPATTALFGIGVGAAYIAKWLIGRK